MLLAAFKWIQKAIIKLETECNKGIIGEKWSIAQKHNGLFKKHNRPKLSLESQELLPVYCAPRPILPTIAMLLSSAL